MEVEPCGTAALVVYGLAVRGGTVFVASRLQLEELASSGKALPAAKSLRGREPLALCRLRCRREEPRFNRREGKKEWKNAKEAFVS
ncbi:hypothetical protein SESBI_22190 [Sesbania bispinosa]|nr:hypothetical protein SESBI_22190 [Sesbania bispinosa]